MPDEEVAKAINAAYGDIARKVNAGVPLAKIKRQHGGDHGIGDYNVRIMLFIERGLNPQYGDPNVVHVKMTAADKRIRGPMDVHPVRFINLHGSFAPDIVM